MVPPRGTIFDKFYTGTVEKRTFYDMQYPNPLHQIVFINHLRYGKADTLKEKRLQQLNSGIHYRKASERTATIPQWQANSFKTFVWTKPLTSADVLMQEMNAMTANKNLLSLSL